MSVKNQTIKCDFPECNFTSENPEDFHQQGKVHACKPCKEGFSAKVKSGAIDTAIRYNTADSQRQAKFSKHHSSRSYGGRI